jgi:HrpA-like RNA helicase
MQKLEHETNTALTLALLETCMRRHSTPKLVMMYRTVDTESFINCLNQIKVMIYEVWSRAIKKLASSWRSTAVNSLWGRF